MPAEASDTYIPEFSRFPGEARSKRIRVYEKYKFISDVYVPGDANPARWLVTNGAQFKTAVSGYGPGSDMLFLNLDTASAIEWNALITAREPLWTDFDVALCVTSVLALRIEDSLTIRHRMVGNTPEYPWIHPSASRKLQAKHNGKPSLPGLPKKPKKKLTKAERLEIILRRFRAKFREAGVDARKCLMTWLVCSKADITWKWWVLSSCDTLPQENWAGLELSDGFLSTILALLEFRELNKHVEYAQCELDLNQHIAGLASCGARRSGIDIRDFHRANSKRIDYPKYAVEVSGIFRSMGMLVPLECTESLDKIDSTGLDIMLYQDNGPSDDEPEAQYTESELLETQLLLN